MGAAGVPAVISLDEADPGLTAFTAFPSAQWKRPPEHENDRTDLWRVSPAGEDPGRPAHPGGDPDGAVGDAGDGLHSAAEAGRLSHDGGHHAATRRVIREPDRITRPHLYNSLDTTGGFGTIRVSFEIW